MQRDDGSKVEDLGGQQVGHLRIDRRLGKGGMGEVYEAWDDRLQRRVALKVMRGQQRLDPTSRSRFLREARILSRLDDPGICRIHDLIEQPECDYLVLEYIDGRTLGRLAREGTLGREQILELAEGMARVLAVAHSANVAHRDLKPDNVMVTSQGHVKILDFGLSRVLGGSTAEPTEAAASPLVPGGSGVDTLGNLDHLTGDPTMPPRSSSAETVDGLTELGSVVGTIRYMSPEQALGGEITEATDLYSLGVILHELLAGASPYSADIGLHELLLSVRRGEAAPLACGDPELEALVAELKSPDPSRRPSARNAAERLAAIREQPRRKRARRIRSALVAGTAALLATAVGVTWQVARRARTPIRAAGRIALLPFADLTGSEGWVRAGLRELVAGRLGTLPTARLVPLEQLEQRLADLGIDTTARLQPEQQRALAETLGTDVVVQTFVGREHDGWGVTYRIASTTRQIERTLVSSSLTVAAERLTGALAEELGLGSLQVKPRDPFADQAYGVGVHLLRTRGAIAARPLFESCQVLEPGFLWARLQLAHCEQLTGHPDRALEVARTVHAEAVTSGDDALAAAALTFTGSLASMRADYETARHDLERALAIQRSRGDVAGEAEAVFHLGTAAYTRGDYPLARQRFQEALELKKSSADIPGESDCLNYLGLVCLNTGDLDSAEALFTEVRRRAEGSGDPRRRAHALVNLGNIADARHQPVEAESLWREALEGLRRAGDTHNELTVLNNLGVLQLDRQDYTAAEATYRELVALATQQKDRVMEAASSLNLAMALLEADRPAEAGLWLGRVTSLDTWVRGHPETLATRAKLAFKQGRPAEAVRLMEECRKAAGKAWGPKRAKELELYREAAARRPSGH